MPVIHGGRYVSQAFLARVHTSQSVTMGAIPIGRIVSDINRPMTMGLRRTVTSHVLVIEWRNAP
jgi:hypothetical protein